MFFNTKNFSPRQLALFTAVILAIPVLLGVWLLRPEWEIVLVSFVVFLAGSYALILAVLQQFIYRKIKLIYKFIYKTKASKKEETYYKYILPQKGIDEVRQDVEKWAIRQEGELEALRSNEKFRKEFLQNLSHELKTPIFAVQSYIDTLLEGGSDDAPVREKFLEKAARNVQRLVNLTKDLDEISRLESGEIPLQKENFVIQDLLREVFEMMHAQIHDRQVKCSIKKGTEFPVTVFADKEKIRQVLINLVDNAIKYGHIGGTVVASIYELDGKRVLVELSDDGAGIPEAHLARIFERFYRTDMARSRKVAGSGLGLAICKHIIEAHGQNIHVRSKPDVGTTIGFTLQGKKEG